MLLQLLAHTLKEPCFDKLRTKEQLGRAILSLLVFCSVFDLVVVCVSVCVCAGYIVASGLRRSHGVQGLRILIQSDKPAAFIESRAEAFLQSFQASNN